MWFLCNNPCDGQPLDCLANPSCRYVHFNATEDSYAVFFEGGVLRVTRGTQFDHRKLLEVLGTEIKLTTYLTRENCARLRKETGAKCKCLHLEVDEWNSSGDPMAWIGEKCPDSVE